MKRSKVGLVATLLSLCTTAPTSTGTAMRTEANREAKRLFLGTRASCGADYALAIDVTSPQGSSFAPSLSAMATPNSGYTLYIVMSGVTVRAREQVSDARRWQGRFSILAEHARVISVG